MMIVQINDDKQNMKKLGWRGFLKSQPGAKTKTIWVFELPEINFQLRSYHDELDQKTNIK